MLTNLLINLTTAIFYF